MRPGEIAMKNMCRTAPVALVAVVFFAVAVHAAENEKGSSLAKQVVGSWTLTSLVLDQDGKKSEPYGPGPKGTVIFTSNGHTAVVITRAELPKFASNNRTTGTPEENKAAVAGSIAYFGTYEVNEADKAVSTHVEASTFPNWVGSDQKRMVELSGDEMKFINKNPSMGQGVVTATWKREKGPRKTAQR
jgi:Lipocalin-like domain